MMMDEYLPPPLVGACRRRKNFFLKGMDVSYTPSNTQREREKSNIFQKKKKIYHRLALTVL
jgi:hypothetical protein